MAKKCIICGKPAEFSIKDSSEAYCTECAEENFGDISLLLKIEQEASKLKKFVETKIQSDGDDGGGQDPDADVPDEPEEETASADED